MKKFSKLVEKLETEKYFKVKAEVDLVIKAENSGEAGYISDSQLGSIEDQIDFRILDISELDESEFQELKVTENLSINEDPETIEKIRAKWFEKFGDENPSYHEKAEFYHQMRDEGFDAYVVFAALKDKMPIK